MVASATVCEVTSHYQRGMLVLVSHEKEPSRCCARETGGEGSLERSVETRTKCFGPKGWQSTVGGPHKGGTQRPRGTGRKGLTWQTENQKGQSEMKRRRNTQSSVTEGIGACDSGSGFGWTMRSRQCNGQSAWRLSTQCTRHGKASNPSRMHDANLSVKSRLTMLRIDWETLQLEFTCLICKGSGSRAQFAAIDRFGSATLNHVVQSW